MTNPLYSLFDVTYPDSDGLPMAESDATFDLRKFWLRSFSRCGGNTKAKAELKW